MYVTRHHFDITNTCRVSFFCRLNVHAFYVDTLVLVSLSIIFFSSPCHQTAFLDMTHTLLVSNSRHHDRHQRPHYYCSGKPADILQKVYLPVLNNAVCSSWYQSQGKHVIVSSRQFCAGFKEGGRDACQVLFLNDTTLQKRLTKLWRKCRAILEDP